MHIGATWRIRLNRPCAAAMRPYVKLLWPLVICYYSYYVADILQLFLVTYMHFFAVYSLGTWSRIRYICLLYQMVQNLPSVLLHCWLGIRNSIQPVKDWVMRCLRGYLSREDAYELYMVQLICCFIKIQNGFLVPAYLGCPGKRPLNGRLFWNGAKLQPIAAFFVVLLRFQNVSCRSVLVGFAEKTLVFGSV